MSEQPVAEVPYKTTITPIKKTIKFGQVEFATAEYEVPPDVEYKGSILFVHGFAEFSDLYVKVLDQLALNGYDCFFFDQRGSGFTSPKKYKGLSNEHYTFKDLEKFVKLRLDKIDNANKPSKKFFLFGHSMGGGIVLNYTVIGKYRDRVSGVVSTAPLVELHPKTRPNIILRNLHPLLNKVLPNFKIDSALKVQYVTSNKEWQDYLLAHPLSATIGSVQLFHDMFARGARLLDPEFLKDQNLEIPIVIFHGNIDKINDVEGSRKFAKVIKVKDFTLEEIEGANHSLLLEKDEIYDKVFGMMLGWLNKH